MIHSSKKQSISCLQSVMVTYEMLWAILILGSFMNGLGDLNTVISIRDAVAAVIMIAFNHLYLHQAVFLKPVVPLYRQKRLFSIHLLFLIAAILVLMHSHGDVLAAFCLAASSAVFEEYALRGLIFGSLLSNASKNFRSILKAMLIASLLFAITHIINLSGQSLYVTSLQIIQTFAFGFLCCALYLRSGSLILPVLLHFLLNFRVLCLNDNQVAVTGHVSLAGELAVTAGYLLIGWFLLRKKELSQFHLLDQL